jgi:hypothetical protein
MNDSLTMMGLIARRPSRQPYPTLAPVGRRACPGRQLQRQLRFITRRVRQGQKELCHLLLAAYRTADGETPSSISRPSFPADQNRAYLVAFRRFLLEQAPPFLERETQDSRCRHVSLRRRRGWQNNRPPLAVQTFWPHENDQEEVGCFKN